MKKEAGLVALGIAVGMGLAPWLAPLPARAAGPAWEYKVEQSKDAQADLNALARQGWENYAVARDGNWTDLYLRRPKP